MISFKAMNITRINFVRIVAVLVLLISVFKITSYLSLATTVAGIIYGENGEGYSEPEFSPSPEVMGIKKEIYNDRILVSKLLEDGQYELFVINKDGSEERLTETPYNEMNAQVSRDGISIIYAANPDTEDYDILRTDLRSGKTINLTNNSANDWDPSFSPDESAIIFMSNRVDKSAGNGDIFYMDSWGNDPTNLTSGMSHTEEWGPTFSPDGRRVYFVSSVEEKSEIYSIEVFGRKISRLTDNDTADWYPKLNHDGLNIVYVCKDPIHPEGHDQICIMNPDGTNTRLIPNQPAEGDSGDPVFGTNDSTLYFVHHKGEAETYNLYSINLDGTEFTKITAGDQKVLSPAIIPTGFNPSR